MNPMTRELARQTQTEEMDNRDGNWKLYKQKLESEIAIKKVFLAQTENLLLTGLFGNKVTESNFQLPMFKPDRSDPIGYSTASYMLTQRLKSSRKVLKEILTTEYPEDVHSMLEELDEKLDTMLIPTESQEHLQETYLIELETLIKGKFSQKYNTTRLTDDEFGNATWDLLQRLLNNDQTLRYGEFKPCGLALFRLLSHTGVISIKLAVDESVLDDNNLVKLMDFDKQYIYDEV